MANIIVLGAGLGGTAAAYEIHTALGGEHRVTLVGDGPRFNFTPSNPWLALGMRQLDVPGVRKGRHRHRGRRQEKEWRPSRPQ